MSNKIELINKLKRLMNSDNESERASAEKKLHLIMDKYKIDESELDDGQDKEYNLYYHNSIERKVLVQVIFKVLGDDYKNKVYVERNKPGKRIKFIVHCTYEQYVEISVQYEFYKELILEDLDTFVTGFIYKHHIFPASSSSADHENTPEELAKVKKAMAMTVGMSDKSFIQRIGDIPE